MIQECEVTIAISHVGEVGSRFLRLWGFLLWESGMRAGKKVIGWATKMSSYRFERQLSRGVGSRRMALC